MVPSISVRSSFSLPVATFLGMTALLAPLPALADAGQIKPQAAKANALSSLPALPPVPRQPAPPRSRLAMLDASDGQITPGGPFRYAITPERRALLNTIRFAEGTWARGEDLGYRVMFGGGLMGGMDRHPNRVIYSGRYASAAAGAYQFMPFTWTMASRKLGLAGFGPHVQDQAAIFLIQRRGALAGGSRRVPPGVGRQARTGMGLIPDPRRLQLLRPAG